MHEQTNLFRLCSHHTRGSPCCRQDGSLSNTFRLFWYPASTTHIYGWQAAQHVAQARQQVADLLHCSPSEIIWTSGATESNNLAIQGVFFKQTDRNHLITSPTQHKSVLDTCKFLRDHHGARLTLLKPKPNGLIDLAELEAAIGPDTCLVSLMHVNNEIGVVQDLQAIGEIAHRHGALYHVDAGKAQANSPST